MNRVRSPESEKISLAWVALSLGVAALAAWFNSFGSELAPPAERAGWFPFAGAGAVFERVLNVGLHVATALGIFGVLRRTLRLPHLNERFGASATTLAWASAAIWMLHPLQTAMVTDLGRRPELIGALGVVLTLYAFVRGARVAAIAACALGMAAHEVALAAPLLVLIYDRTFLTGSFREAWRAGRGFYLGLAATAVLVGVKVLAGDFRGEPAPWGEPLTAWPYLQVQCQAVVHYLRLAFWPDPLVFDYGVMRPKPFVWVLPPMFFLLSLLLATIAALWQARARGFLGAWFFLLLAPTSSAWPVAAESMAESRMYLPLAAVVVLGVLGLHRLAGARSFLICAVVALAAGGATVVRNTQYRDALSLWADAAAKAPGNARALAKLSALQLEAGHVDEAISSGAEAVGLAPYFAEGHFALGQALHAAGRRGPARRHLEQAAKLAPERFGAGSER